MTNEYWAVVEGGNGVQIDMIFKHKGAADLLLHNLAGDNLIDAGKHSVKRIRIEVLED